MKKTKHSPPKHSQFTPTMQLAMAALLFSVVTILSRGEEISQLEIAIFRGVYGLPDFLHSLFVFITQFGSVYVLGILLLVFLIKRHHHVALRLLLTGTLAYTMAGVAKDLWGRVRPYDFFTDIVSLDALVRGPGYPSGHAAMATALALTLGYYWHNKYRWVVAALIIGVSLSRMYLGVHLPLDVVGGFAIGWAAYALFRHVRLQDVTRRKKRS